MTFGSLFAGIGGFDLGFENAGARSVWQVEIDPKCRELLERKFPHAKRSNDVRTVGKQELEPVDVICGGFPCQDLSVAGRRAGFDGDRSSLWFEFARVVEELHPTFVVIENVPGLLSSNEGRDMATLVRGLEERGYGWAYRVLDAQYFGVAQRRRRVFIVGHSDPRRAAEILFESESLCRDSAPRRTTGKDIAYALRREPSHSGDKGDGGINCTLIGFDTCDDRSSVPNEHTTDPLRVGGIPGVAGTLAASGAGSSRPAGNCNETDLLVAGTLGAHKTGGWGNDLDNTAGVRRLTPVECERLQGFPDGWTEGFADSVRYRMLGNAVTVNVARWIGRRLMEPK